jgi:hypothetical protein
MPSVADALRPTLGETGQIYVTAAAARRFLEARGYKEHEMETARRELTELLLDARQLQNDARTWRARKRSTKLDISAIVEQAGRLLVVTFITVQAYDPPSRTSGNRQGGRSRFPDAPQGSTAPGRGVATTRSPRRSGGRGGARSA